MSPAPSSSTETHAQAGPSAQLPSFTPSQPAPSSTETQAQAGPSAQLNSSSLSQPAPPSSTQSQAILTVDRFQFGNNPPVKLMNKLIVNNGDEQSLDLGELVSVVCHRVTLTMVT